MREIISKSHEEINQTCIEDLAKEIRNRQESIDKLVGRESVKLIKSSSQKTSHAIESGIKEKDYEDFKPVILKPRFAEHLMLKHQDEKLEQIEEESKLVLQQENLEP